MNLSDRSSGHRRVRKRSRRVLMKAGVCTATHGTLCALHLPTAAARQPYFTRSRYKASSALGTAPPARA